MPPVMTQVPLMKLVKDLRFYGFAIMGGHFYHINTLGRPWLPSSPVVTLLYLVTGN